MGKKARFRLTDKARSDTALYSVEFWDGEGIWGGKGGFGGLRLRG